MSLAIRSSRITLQDLELQADIGFHDFEIGAPQRLLVTVELWIEAALLPVGDEPEAAWDYDFIRTRILELAGARRYNLQETLAGEIWREIARRDGVIAASITVRKPDIYPDCASVGVTISSAPPPAP